MTTPWILARRSLASHWVRSGLTFASLFVALFLFCTLVSVVTSTQAAVSSSASNRIITQSAVSLFVELPRDYLGKIRSVPGVEQVTRFQWFGGYYQEPTNFFAQFGVDQDVFFDMYAKDVEVLEGPGGETGPAARDAVVAAMAADRRAAIIGEGLMRKYGWKIGDTVPLIGTIFPMLDGSAWDFVVVGSYRPLKSNVDDATLWFRYDYVAEMVDGGLAAGPRGVGVYSTNVAPGHEPAQVIAEIDALFANGPQVTMTSTEAAFQASFLSMLGNLPFFLGTIGGAVVFAVIFSVVNTMLMSARQRLREAGILKALGYSDGSLARLMLGESLLLSVLGGLSGTLFAWGIDEGFRRALGSFLPTYHVEPATVFAGLGISVAIGVVAGVAPAVMSARLRPTEALRSEG